MLRPWRIAAIVFFGIWFGIVLPGNAV